MSCVRASLITRRLNCCEMPRPFDRPNADTPMPGYYAVRLCRGGVECAAQIILHEDGSLSGLINGEAVSPYDTDEGRTFPNKLQNIWLFGRPIEKHEYDYLLARLIHYQRTDPNSPLANPLRKINRRLLPPIGG
jgi:hypothetical protein